MRKIRTFNLEKLDCVNCGNKIEQKAASLEGVECANLNFVGKNIKLGFSEDAKEEDIIKYLSDYIKKIEPHVIFSEALQIEGDGSAEVEEYVEPAEALDNAGGKDSDSESQGLGRKVLNIVKDEKVQLAGAMALFLIGLIVPMQPVMQLIICLAAYVLAGREVVYFAVRDILGGRVFDENFLMTLATVGAFAIGQYPEAAAVMIFYQIGETLQDMAVDKSRGSISKLLNIRPDYANLISDDLVKKVKPEKVHVGNLILIKPGEKVPLDGVIENGVSELDVKSLTGESVPKAVNVGDQILSGSVNLSGVLQLRVEKEFGESTVSKILELVENAAGRKAVSERFITKFANIYTPVVVFLALGIGLLPPIITGSMDFSKWIYKGLVFLVVSCPCALVLSIPLAYFGGIGAASREGILIKGGNYLEMLKNTGMVVFDKTGTLTRGEFSVKELLPEEGFTREDLLRFGGDAERFTSHPIGKAIREKAEKEGLLTVDEKGEELKHLELAGMGIEATISGRQILAGNQKLMITSEVKGFRGNGVESDGETKIYISVNNQYAGEIRLVDQVKPESYETIKRLEEGGITQIVMLTGDNKKVGAEVAKELEIKEHHAELLPVDKVVWVEKLRERVKNEKSKRTVVFVGDGINDAPVLALADVGIAMGGVGSDAAIEAADVIIMDDKLHKIPLAIEIAKKTNRLVWQNIILAMAVKGIVLTVGAVGMATIWEAVFADVGVALLAVLNANRILRRPSR